MGSFALAIMRVMLAIFVACFIFFSPTKTHSNHGIKKVLSVVKDIKKNMINVDDVVRALSPIIEDNCACCNLPKYCQDGWDYFPRTNKCYKHFNYSTIITWMDAQNTCRQFGGNLPTINDDETNQYVSNLVGGAYNWIGAYRVGPSNVNDQFAWIDGSPLVYAPWSSGNPSNNNGNELCVEMLTNETYDASWNDYDCWSESASQKKVMDFVCQIDVQSIFKQIEGECPDGWTYFDQTNRCYALFNEPSITWMDAQYNCTKLGGDLAMIFDDQTNDFVSTVSGGSIAWIGAHRVGPLTDPKPRNDQFTWIDGSALEFSNWSGGQPDNYNGDEFCVEMNTFGSATWNDQWCNANRNYYICQV